MDVRTAAPHSACQRVRFSHVDAAGIVFYPRYMEMIVNAFPRIANQSSQHRLSFEFRHPAKLGDNLQLATDSSDGVTTVRAVAGENEIFCFRHEPAGEARARQQSSQDASCEKTIRIARWMVGPDKCLHVSRYHEFVSEIVEDWFTDGLGESFSSLREQLGVSVPTVILDSVISELPALDKEVSMKLFLVGIGSRSIRLQLQLSQAGEVLVRTHQVLVLVTHHQDGISSSIIPERLSQRLHISLVENCPE